MTGASLAQMVATPGRWPTLMARDGDNRGASPQRVARHTNRSVGLDDRASLWATPMARDHRSGYASETALSKNTRPLSEQAVSRWPTPRVAVGGYTRDRGDPDRPRATLEGLAQSFPCSPLPPVTLPDGPVLPSERLSLNPLFVEWLMGWPIGWTACACSETELSRWKRRMRCALSRLALLPGIPVQTTLFD